MLKRRDFLQNSAVLGLGALVLPDSFSSLLRQSPMPPAGLQLFTFFSVMDDDVQGTLKKVAAIGYKNIESAFSKKGGYYGMKPKEFTAMVKDLGMSWKSHHVLGAPFKMPAGAKLPVDKDGKPMVIPPMRNLRDNYQALIDEVVEGGVEYLVCANTPIDTPEDVKNSIDVLNKASEAAKKAGIIMAYHNHDKEFTLVGDKKPYDLFLSETNPDNLKMELDLCWAVKAGVDPVDLFKKNPGRFHLLHVKDVDKDLKGPVDVGTGIIDFKRIFANADLAGMKYYFIEQDFPKGPLASATVSYQNLKKILGKNPQKKRCGNHSAGK